jgi:hypothetical protein
MRTDSGTFTTISERQRFLKMKKQAIQMIENDKRQTIKKKKSYKNQGKIRYARVFWPIIFGFFAIGILNLAMSLSSISVPEETKAPIITKPTEMQNLYKEIAIIVENMDIKEGLEGINTLEELIEKQTGEKVYVQYELGESDTEEGERYIIKTLGRSHKSTDGRFRKTSIAIKDKETGEEIYIIWEYERHPEKGGTMLYPVCDYSMNIGYLDSDYRVESFRYDYEEDTTYTTTYKLYDDKGSYIETIEEKYDNVFEVFNALYE